MYTIQGPCTSDSKDVRVAQLSNEYKIIYWGGDAAESVGLWSYQLSYFRGTLDFDVNLDHPVDLRAAGIRMWGKTQNGDIPLSSHVLGAREDARIIFQDGKGLNREVMFPARPRPRYIPAHVLVL
jgi:hypothetical protein